MRSLRPLVLLAALHLPVLPALAETRLPEGQAEISLSFAPVVKQAAPAVVNIYVRQLVETRSSPFAGDPFFQEFFGAMGQDFGPARQRVENSLGSGVIVSPDGIVISNYHVTGTATDIRVVLSDRREYDAKVLLSDQQSDLAVLKIESETPLPFLELGDSEALEVGDLVLAIGNPFGIGQTVSSGIVSGLARSALQVGDGSGYFVQTDAPINPGNSGGALVDMAGRLIGINSAIVTTSGGSNGIGFAIPANLVQAVIAQAREGSSHFARPWAGISGQLVDGGLADALGMDLPRGVLISGLHPQSPFAAAGLREGDVVLSLAGQPVNTPQEFLFRLSLLPAGKAVAFEWLQDGAVKSGEITPAAAPDSPERLSQVLGPREGLEGLGLARINPSLIAEYRLALNAAGVVVTATEGISGSSGLRPGDIITGINGQAVELPRDVGLLLVAAGRRVQIDLIRDGQPLRLRFRL
ncbi:trypsin-like peptidase domain-containing protein [Pseudogemmobacter faecipullorum]|uniref:Trypsin-like peptidase domain-containing protein n=1 Tax=Pseudogemmobacter faecipullorum TaxID=2755041 RepID=A0ABS8CQA3_9RHOB|nr:trypsin-like peptidase domain-containing protein [Pseudogemmobacter faecipullorum]MCB5411564.1 trypsin-like peptidase domain-containing protein [Pseudogemmobacter faecipullorum]